MSYPTEEERRHKVFAGAAISILLLSTLTVAFWPASLVMLTGVRGSTELAPPDELPPFSSEDATPFFRDRDQIEIRVAEAITLRRFLDRNRLNKPYHRKQIVEQLGNASPDAEIAAGTVFQLRLTPVAEDVPGTLPAQPR